MNPHAPPPDDAEARFGKLFAHFDPLVSYAARRGSSDPEGIAAETMAIAWRRLSSVPADDPRPWLFVTARNLLMTEWRRNRPHSQLDEATADPRHPPAVETTDPLVTSALRRLSPGEREVLLLVAWDDLTPAQGALADINAHHTLVAPNGSSENVAPPSNIKGPFEIFAPDGGFQFVTKMYADAAAGRPAMLFQSCRVNR
jgi:hypothetical protein